MNAACSNCLAALLLACTIASCSPAAMAGARGPTTTIAGNDGADATATPPAEGEHASGATGCVVRQAARTFVGFGDKQSLDNFDLTAREAERALAAAKVELCQLAPAQDKDGTLRAALSGGVVEVTAVRFSNSDLTSAVLNLQTAPPDGAGPSALEIRWIAQLKRAANDWHVVSAVRQKTKSGRR